MARCSLPPEYMLPKELAKRVGMNLSLVCSIMRADSKRQEKVFPFAFTIENETTGTW